MSRKYVLPQERDLRQMICKFRLLLRAAEAHMNRQAGSLSIFK